MVYRSKYGDLTDLGEGRFRLNQSIKPRNYPKNGSWHSYNLDWKDDAVFGNLVNETNIETGTGDQSIAIVSPYGQLDNAVTIGLPHVWEGGVLVPINTLEPQRNRNKLKWKGSKDIDLEQENAGHYFKTTIEFLHNYVPEGNRIAFPIDPAPAVRLDRIKGRFISRQTDETLMRLRKSVMIDLAKNPFSDQRRVPVPQEFLTIDGVTYVIYTMPDYSAMTRPALDPTLDLQPDANAGVDTIIREESPTQNYGITASFYAGTDFDGGAIRGLIQFDVSSIPATAIIDEAIFTLYQSWEYSTSDETIGIYRAMTEWFEGLEDGAEPNDPGSTWEDRDGDAPLQWGGDTWGGLSGTDYAVTESDDLFIDGDNFPTYRAWTGLAQLVQDWIDGTYTNRGMWLISDDESSSETGKAFDSSDGATANQRPEFEIDYTEAAGVSMAMDYYRRRRNQ